MESHILQTSVGDLPSAVIGFDALVRSRRGAPWTGNTAAAANEEASADTWRNDNTETADGGGDGGEDHGGSSVAPDALEVFCEQHEGAVREFTARAASNLVQTNGLDLYAAGWWAADTFDISNRGNNFVTALHKLDHDREQLEYLVAKKRLPQEFERLAKEYGAVRELLAATYAGTTADWEQIPWQGFLSALYGLGSTFFERLRGTYNSLIYVPPGPAEGGLGGSHPTGFRRALNPNLDWNAIEEEYLSQELPLLWFDGFLSPEALEGVLEFCREATVFFDIKPGYLGAYFNEGLTSPWLVQIAHELQERLPRVLEGMTLSNLWAYKFDSDTSMDGIGVHADHATVNLNFWVTPDEANLDPSSGGLVVYPKAPPAGAEESGDSSREKEMNIKNWNTYDNCASIESWLKDEGVYDLAVTVPYRQNRINLTFLFSPAAPAEQHRYSENKEMARSTA
eukprot:g2694.t2